MKIKITEKNRDKIEKALADVNGRAKSFTVTSFHDVIRVSDECERELGKLPKSMRKGTTAYYRPSGPTANAYKYVAKSTGLNLERFATGWFLTGVVEDIVYPGNPELLNIVISCEQADEIQRRSISRFFVRKEP